MKLVERSSPFMGKYPPQAEDGAGLEGLVQMKSFTSPLAGEVARRSRAGGAVRI